MRPIGLNRTTKFIDFSDFRVFQPKREKTQKTHKRTEKARERESTINRELPVGIDHQPQYAGAVGLVSMTLYSH